MRGSNLRPPPCRGGALPAELIALPEASVSAGKRPKRQASRAPGRLPHTLRLGPSRRRGGVATQRPAKPSTPVRFRSSPLTTRRLSAGILQWAQDGCTGNVSPGRVTTRGPARPLNKHRPGTLGEGAGSCPSRCVPPRCLAHARIDVEVVDLEVARCCHWLRSELFDLRHADDVGGVFFRSR
jgi:hypothetical protein